MQNNNKKDQQIPIDLWSLRIFLMVCETGSMTAAAQRLNMTQPAVSRVIQLLEQEFGTQIVDRNIRPVALTAAGGVLRQRAENLLREAAQIVPAVRQSAQTRLSILRIGIIDSLAATLGPTLATELSNVTTELAVWSGLSIPHGDALLKRQLDMAITSDPLEDVDGLDRFLLVREPHVILLPVALSDLSRMDINTLSQSAPLIRYSARSHTGILIDRHLRRLGVVIPRKQEFDSSEMVVAMVEAGLGWAITTPICLLAANYNRERVAAFRFPGPTVQRQLNIIARADELGSIPATVANFGRSILRETLLPRINAEFGDIGVEITVPAAAAKGSQIPHS